MLSLSPLARFQVEATVTTVKMNRDPESQLEAARRMLTMLPSAAQLAEKGTAKLFHAEGYAIAAIALQNNGLFEQAHEMASLAIDAANRLPETERKPMIMAEAAVTQAYNMMLDRYPSKEGGLKGLNQTSAAVDREKEQRLRNAVHLSTRAVQFLEGEESKPIRSKAYAVRAMHEALSVGHEGYREASQWLGRAVQYGGIAQLDREVGKEASPHLRAKIPLEWKVFVEEFRESILERFKKQATEAKPDTVLHPVMRPAFSPRSH